MNKFVEEAKKNMDRIISHRRYLHENTEIGMETENSCKFIMEVLTELRYKPEKIGRSGVVATVGDPLKGKTFLLRADMDALPIKEETGLSFASKNEYMHACGHDCHVAMLLGAAEILKQHESEINGCIKLLFQAGEEIMEGALDAVNAGVLENPKVDAAAMIHIVSGMDFPSGVFAIFGGGPTYASVDWFKISINGKGSHGAQPENSINPLAIMTNIYNAINEYIAMSVPPYEQLVVSVGEMHGGTVANVIPDTAYMTGTIRGFNEDLRKTIKQKLIDLSSGIAELKGGTATVEFYRSAPYLMNDEEVSKGALKSLKNIVGEQRVINLKEFLKGSSTRVMGSEDFAYIAKEVPSAVILFSAGSKEEGYMYPAHHPKCDFDESVFYLGAAGYAQVAFDWLKF